MTESTEPVLLVVVHALSERLSWCWIDNALLHELSRRDPAWVTQGTVSIDLLAGSILDAEAKKRLEQHVVGFRRSPKRVLSPGTYHRLHVATLGVADTLCGFAGSTDFASVKKRLADLTTALRNCTYRVAMAGQPRAGKSTLMNALLGRDVSPVGRLPTTAVAMLAVGGAKEEVEVAFESGATEVGPVDSAFLARFATQDLNPDNEKGVRLVTVRLVNQLLERGVAYADAPGLHDVSGLIRRITDSLLGTANVVIYVLNVYAAGAGGFSITDTVMEDLRRLTASADRLFLVLNKVEHLDQQTLLEVESYVARTLRKQGLWDSLPCPAHQRQRPAGVGLAP